LPIGAAARAGSGVRAMADSATGDLSIPPFLDRTGDKPTEEQYGETAESAAPVPARPSPELDDLVTRINDEHRAATNALRQGVLEGIGGGDLIVKAKAQLKHGGWLDWLKANCEIPERTVQAYMRLARLPIEKRNAVADLPLREALSAIRSRQERLERAEAAENRPPPGPARICTVAS